MIYSRYLLSVMFCLIYLKSQVRSHMASLGIKRFQDLIGRTDLLKVYFNKSNPKAQMLDYSAILLDALSLRPGTSIIGGSVKQDFALENRTVRFGIFLKAFFKQCIF